MKYLFLILVSCAQVKYEYKFSSQEVILKPGQVTFVKFDLPKDYEGNKLFCFDNEIDELKGKEILFSRENNIGFTYFAEDYFSNYKGKQCYLIYKNKYEKILETKILPYPYQSEKLNVAMSKIDLSIKDQKRVLEEAKLMEKVYSRLQPVPLFKNSFSIPLNSYRTSVYGTKRLFNNKKTGQHLGNDFRAAIGTPIPVSNDGVVIFVGNLFYTGNVVIVDHGLNITTNYAHLSKINVKDGDQIKKGDIVGLSGATGRVSGPHLHWGVKIQGHHVDGFSLVESSEKHFKQK